MLPAHIGYIMDGNGRWAERRGLPRTAGYTEGAKAMQRVIEHTAELGVKAATVYAFSAENFARPDEEIQAIAKVVAEWNDSYRGPYRMRYIGERERLGDRLLGSIEDVERRTAGNDGFTLVVALAYGGREDIVNAAKRAAARGEITTASFESELSTAGLPPLDLIVRSGGEKRLSGFMLYQSAYSELYFSDKLWPDFTAEDVDAAVADFAARRRKFGA